LPDQQTENYRQLGVADLCASSHIGRGQDGYKYVT
jgi:hypothetical protein